MVAVEKYFQLQHGLITTEQARQAGLSRHQVATLARKGDWIVVRRGVFRSSHVRMTWESQVLGQLLGRNAVASHLCSASLYNLEIAREPRAEITVPHGARALAGTKVHRTTQWDLRNETQRRGLPCTGVERTVLDLAKIVSIDQVELAAEAAIRQDLSTWTAIERAHQLHADAGRVGSGKIRDLLNFRKHAATVPRSGFSRRVSQLLVRGGLPEPVVEHAAVTPDGGHILYLDLAWPHLMKAWELDGLEWHFHRGDLERDKDKRNRCKGEGWRIQEITWKKFRENPDDLVAMARKFLAS